MNSRLQNYLALGASLFLLGSVVVSVMISDAPDFSHASNHNVGFDSILAKGVSSPRTNVNTDHLVLMSEVPFISKKPDFGGEACVAMCLQYLKHNVDQDFVFDQANVEPILGRGCVTKELVRALKKIGFQPGDVWFSTNERSLLQIWSDTVADLKQMIPSVFCRIENGREEFVLVIGADLRSREFILHDPNIEQGEAKRIPLDQFLASCRLGDSATQNPMVVRMRLEAVSVPSLQMENHFTDADYAQHVRKLKLKLPSDEFHIVIQKPFVVIGDRRKQDVKRWATGTVNWAVDRLKKDYFSKDPRFILDVWLFKDTASYEKHNLSLFGQLPSTTYGFYSTSNRALVMNINTGGGTLVHEIVHPFVESNFPNCPSWFNEGLGSLYEQSRDENGHIKGSTNWRLRGLQAAIEDERVPSFEELCSTSRQEFYDGHVTNYAQARYLCYYLQERGLLVKFYHEFVKNAAADPTGYQTLQRMLGNPDMDQFQNDWQAFVMKLRFAV